MLQCVLKCMLRGVWQCTEILPTIDGSVLCVLQCVTACCSASQRVALCCSVLQHIAVCGISFSEVPLRQYARILTVCNHTCNALQHTATHCNTLQHTATHCNTLQHTATHCITLHHTASTGVWVTNSSFSKILKSQPDTQFMTSNDYKADF